MTNEINEKSAPLDLKSVCHRILRHSDFGSNEQKDSLNIDSDPMISDTSSTFCFQTIIIQLIPQINQTDLTII